MKIIGASFEKKLIKFLKEWEEFQKFQNLLGDISKGNFG